MDNFSHLDPDPNPSCGSGSNSPLKIHFHLRTQVILLELLRVSEDCFPQRAGAVEIHHMHHHHILPLRLPLSVNRHGALEGDGPQPSQALVDHYPQHAARVQMRGGGRKCFKDKAAAFSCRPWQARTPPPCTNCCCCCAIIDWCCCCVWVCSVTLLLCRMNDRICSSRGEMKSELADSPPPTLWC